MRHIDSEAINVTYEQTQWACCISYTSSSLTFAYSCSLPSCDCKAFRIPNAAELQYNVSYASTVMAISSRIRDRRKPRSAQTMVTCLIISSVMKARIVVSEAGVNNCYGCKKLPKHWVYSSRRAGQIPVSRAWVCCNRASNNSCKLVTSWRVAGTLDTWEKYGFYQWQSAISISQPIPSESTIDRLLPKI